MVSHRIGGDGPRSVSTVWQAQYPCANRTISQRKTACPEDCSYGRRISVRNPGIHLAMEEVESGSRKNESCCNTSPRSVDLPMGPVWRVGCAPVADSDAAIRVLDLRPSARE